MITDAPDTCTPRAWVFETPVHHLSSEARRQLLLPTQKRTNSGKEAMLFLIAGTNLAQELPERGWELLLRQLRSAVRALEPCRSHMLALVW